MKDVNKARLQIIKEIKAIHGFFDTMERGVKTREPQKVWRAYHFLQTLVYHMDKGDLTPDSIELFQAIREDYYRDLEDGAS